ncbi:DUF5994 family protein [Gordonia sp. ABSL11-1]|uniref:DUF5994 family protein n=1 Tax=Gordonia sp. ABSL11-1 TaxID=3053924 RepID=UPI002572AAF6|nr:DUF5994 family protein [Gordonia sp. ABSL11-1]MDL9944312.1 DUF5994 family protein [Gordonia sp. ABSL11-1]
MTRTLPPLRLRDFHTPFGLVQGVRPPTTTDLESGLHELIPYLAPHIGSLERVAYRINDWGVHDAQPVIRGRRIRIDGFWRVRWASITLGGRHRSIELATRMPTVNRTRVHRVAEAI